MYVIFILYQKRGNGVTSSFIHNVAADQKLTYKNILFKNYSDKSSKIN